MPASGHIGQKVLKPAPVIQDRSVIGPTGHHLAGQAVRELQLDGLPVLRVTVAGLIGPEHQTRHGLHACILRLQYHITPSGTFYNFLRACAQARRAKSQCQKNPSHQSCFEAKVIKVTQRGRLTMRHLTQNALGPKGRFYQAKRLKETTPLRH
jgi:hypothetical protein